tara:strand:+ start:207 stop:575 length:369 start_codon:yes stop_codon:yes gene_type:complete
MAHFAKLDAYNNVVQVYVVANPVITDKDGKEQESLGVDFLNKTIGVGWYKQTSYNGAFRKNYATIGGTYDADKNAFINPQPFPSWSLNSTTCLWEPPTAYPSDKTKQYLWDEPNLKWKEVTG